MKVTIFYSPWLCLMLLTALCLMLMSSRVVLASKRSFQDESYLMALEIAARRDVLKSLVG